VFVAAVLTGLLLRLVWVIIATRSPHAPLGDATKYLEMADGFSRGKLPTFYGGRPTAFYAPGYSFLLVPAAWLSRATGWFSLAFAASLLNVVGGTVTVAATGFLAGRWIGPTSRNVAAWIMAVAPAQIFFTSTAHAESVFTGMFLVGLILITRIIEQADDDKVPARALAAVGVFIGFAMIVRSPGGILLVAGALVLRAVRGRWKGALRATGALVAGSLVILVPWAVVTGIHTGAWTPFSTQNATVLCVGHHEEATGGFPTDLPRDLAQDCYRYSPFDDPALDLAPGWWDYHHPDEARWYRESSRRGITYALTHPLDEVWLSHQKFVRLWGTEWDGLSSARNYEDRVWTGDWTGPLDAAANLWLWAVEALGVFALLSLRVARRAMPIWAVGGLVSLLPIAGLAQPHFRHPAIPFIVVLASATVVAINNSWRGRPYEAERDTDVAVGVAADDGRSAEVTSA
jgi:hypothetical protein